MKIFRSRTFFVLKYQFLFYAIFEISFIEGKIHTNLQCQVLFAQCKYSFLIFFINLKYEKKLLVEFQLFPNCFILDLPFFVYLTIFRFLSKAPPPWILVKTSFLKPLIVSLATIFTQ